MDAIDRKILAELQAEGRLTVTELAERVSLSVAPCHRRLRELERTKAIRGYRAVIDPAAIGLGFEVLVQVTMDREDATTIARFESGLAEIAEVRHAERLFGDPDYLIRVATADLAAYQEMRDAETRHPARRAAAELHDRDEAHRRGPAVPDNTLRGRACLMQVRGQAPRYRSEEMFWFLDQTVKRAWDGDRRAARMAGSSPARAPMMTAAARPPAQACGGITTVSPWPRA